MPSRYGGRDYGILPSTTIDVDAQSTGVSRNLEPDDWGCRASSVLEPEPKVAEINLIVAVQNLRSV